MRNTITNRQMLLGLAAASPPAATTTEASVPENPELVRLGNETATIERNTSPPIQQHSRCIIKTWRIGYPPIGGGRGPI